MTKINVTFAVLSTLLVAQFAWSAYSLSQFL